MNDIVFFYKSRPNFKSQPLDLLPSCIRNNTMFLPYPTWAGGVAPYIPNDYPQDLMDFRKPSPLLVKPLSKQSQALNLIKKIETCRGKKWAVIPRIGDGCCWIAEINSGYKIWSKSEPWLGSLNGILQNSPYSANPVGCYHMLADAAQGWDTTTWLQVSFNALPRWFSKQLLAQGSFGEIHGVSSALYPVGLSTPGAVAATGYANPNCTPIPPPTTNPHVLMPRLVERLSPTAFEFLCVELLSLSKYKGCALWSHVGGVGDGGVDGIGFDPTGNPTAFLTVKWQISTSTLIHIPSGNPSIVLAYLLGTPSLGLLNNVIKWGPLDIANLVLAHKANLSTSFRNLLGV